MPEFIVAAVLHFIEDLLHAMSSVLYLPVLLALVLLVIHLLACSGGLLREWRQRRRGIRALVISAEAQLAAAAAGHDGQLGLDVQLERVLQHAEAAGMRALDRVRFAVRIGPALGLMGTLIPMGIALAGLAQGNLPQMAQSMVVAFAATVVGLACSVLAYVLSLVREHWLRVDLGDIEYTTEGLLARHASKGRGHMPAAAGT